MTVMRLSLVLGALAALLVPAPALAWGVEGHAVVALIAKALLKPDVRAKVDALLEGDAGNALTAHDIAAEAYWADAWRGAGHRETASWHFVNLELDHPDLTKACFGFPTAGQTASTGPANDCVVNKIEAFSAELKANDVSPEERLSALKYLLHFVGDLGQPLHAADNYDRGGNCVLIALGDSRTVNLHAYWDTAVVEALGSDAHDVAARLLKTITPQKRAVWTTGGPRAWANDSYAIARMSVYLLGSPPGCVSDPAPIALPPGYAANARTAAAEQLAKSGARLAALLNQDL